MDPEIVELRKLTEELYKKTGQQNIELEFLKKSTSKSRTCEEGACGKGALEIERKTSVRTYLFYIEIDAHMDKKVAQNFLGESFSCRFC
ncbi:MAG TPA: hypothetical protein VFG01_00425 [Acidobacteriota bacterium]|nr:hypothetical protein [Acidobacteriota bacterium]